MTSLLESFDTANLQDLFRPGCLGKEIFMAESFYKRELYEFCRKPVTGDITYYKEGKRTTRILGDMDNSYAYFKLLQNNKVIPTLFLHRIESIEKSLVDTVYDISPPQNWRFSNVSASISSQNSSIGFHADTMDVIIFQTYGSRSWNLWKKENMDPEYVRALEKNIILPAPQNPGPPDISFDLHPGDVMHIPAHWGHQGITTSQETSFSLSFSWCHFTPCFFLFKVFKESDYSPHSLPDVFYQSYLPESFDKESLTEYLHTLVKEHNIPGSPEAIRESIDFTLAELTSPGKQNRTPLVARQGSI